MRGHADVVQVLEEIFRDPVVEDALALDHLMLLGIERGGVVLEVLDQGARLRTFIQDLAFAFINATPTAHRDVPCVVEIHGNEVLRRRDSTHDGAAVKAWNRIAHRNIGAEPKRETEQEPGLWVTYPISPRSTIDPSDPGRGYPRLVANGADQGHALRPCGSLVASIENLI